MRELDEDTALATIFANTRRKKRTENLLTIAQSFKYLVELYGSQKAVADKVGLSTEMIREFLIVLKLPVEVQQLISSRQIDSVDVAREISAIKDPLKQVVTAKILADALSEDVRDIKRLIKDTNFPIEEAKKIILESKPRGLHIFMMDFDDEIYKLIIKQAKSMKIKPAELVKEIVTDWLKTKRMVKRNKR